MIQLLSEQPFARGGNRLCFVAPDNASHCIKVRRPDFSLEDRRRKKGFPKNLKPLSSFDDNKEEWEVMQYLDHHLGEPVYQCVSRCWGFVDTDMGPGLVSELVRNADGSIAETFKKVLWDEGFTEKLRAAVEQFVDMWARLRVPSRDLLLHNLVVQRHGEDIQRIVVIDGLGSQGLLPFFWLPKTFQQKKVGRKVTNLYQRIDKLLGQRGQDTFPGYHGLLFHNDAPSRKHSGTGT